jgi:hypothetical protein
MDENNKSDHLSCEQLTVLVKELISKHDELETRIKELTEQIQSTASAVQQQQQVSPTTSISPVYNFNDLPNKIIIRGEHLDSLKDCNMTQVMINILEDMQPPLPMLCFSHKLYIYSSAQKWKECNNEELIAFLNKIHQKFVKEMCEWYSANKEQINSSDYVAISYNKKMIKLMGIDFKSKGVLSKIKTNLCKYLKTLTINGDVM